MKRMVLAGALGCWLTTALACTYTMTNGVWAPIMNQKCLVEVGDSTVGQRWAVIFAPIPDEELVLNYQYSLIPELLTDSTSVYPLGTPLVHLAIEAGGLAFAELRTGRTNGVQEARYRELVLAAIAEDRTFFQAEGAEALTDEDSGFTV